MGKIQAEGGKRHKPWKYEGYAVVVSSTEMDSHPVLMVTEEDLVRFAHDHPGNVTSREILERFSREEKIA